MDEKFQKYLQFGGMPVLREFKFNEARSNQALEGIYSTVILRDILQRNSGADEATLQKIMLFLCSSIGSMISPNSIGKVLSNEGDIRTGKQKKYSRENGCKIHFYAVQCICILFCWSVRRKGKAAFENTGQGLYH